jgi:hypothetical protein
MKKIVIPALIALSLAACDIFTAQPQPFPVWSPIPSHTPAIVSPTPIIFTVTPNATIITSITPVNSDTPTLTPTTTRTTSTDTSTPTIIQSAQVDIIGCNTSFDVTHGMGEVTNAYVTVKNVGNADLPNTCALLRAIDEDRVHPDKKKCVPNLPVQNQVTLKLTVDSEYKQDTAIQVDVSSNDSLLLRMDKQSCTAISLFGDGPPDIDVVKPIK